MAFLQYKYLMTSNIQTNKRNQGSSNIISQNTEICGQEVKQLRFTEL